jgi:hypothetical protein
LSAQSPGMLSTSISNRCKRRLKIATEDESV